MPRRLAAAPPSIYDHPIPRRLFPLLAIAAAGAIAAGLAFAPRAGGTPSALTPAERQALRIASVDAAGEEPVGLVVTVTFRGNLQTLIGRGNLKHAAVVMLLEPASAGPTEAAVLTQGPGVIGETLRRTQSTQVGVVRDGSTFEFLIHGPGVSRVRNVVVKTFAAKPTAKSRRLAGSGVKQISAADLRALDTGVAQDSAALDLAKKVFSQTPCNELDALKQLVVNTQASTLKADVALGNLQGALKAQIAKLRQKPASPARVARVWRKLARQVGQYIDSGAEPTDSAGLVKALESYLEQVKVAKARADFLLDAEKAFATEIDDRKRACFNNFPISGGYDHTAPGDPPSQYPSTVCADFGPSQYFHSGDSWYAYLEDEQGNVLKTHSETFASEGGGGRVVFGIPRPGTYVIVVDVPSETDRAEVRIPVPTPPPYDKSKDCSGTPPA